MAELLPYGGYGVAGGAGLWVLGRLGLCAWRRFQLRRKAAAEEKARKKTVQQLLPVGQPAQQQQQQQTPEQLEAALAAAEYRALAAEAALQQANAEREREQAEAAAERGGTPRPQQTPQGRGNPLGPDPRTPIPGVEEVDEWDLGNPRHQSSGSSTPVPIMDPEGNFARQV